MNSLKGLAEVPMFIDMLGRRALLYLCKRVLNRTGVSGQRHFIGIPVSEVHLPGMNFLYSWGIGSRDLLHGTNLIL